MQTLPNDVARCHGALDENNDLMEECADCLRRVPAIAQEARGVSYMHPPRFDEIGCQYHIESN